MRNVRNGTWFDNTDKGQQVKKGVWVKKDMDPAVAQRRNLNEQVATFQARFGGPVAAEGTPRGGGGRGRGGYGRPQERKTIKGFGGEQAAMKEAEEKEQRAGDWDDRFNKPGNAAFDAREQTKADEAENARRANAGEPSIQTERGAKNFREANAARRDQESMGGAANQEMLQTGRAPMQDGTITTTTGKMAFKGGRQVGKSTFANAARRRR